MIRTREAIELDRRAGKFTRFLLVFNDRGTEWFAAYVMFAWGVVLALPGDTLASPQFAAFGRLGLTEEHWAWLFSIIGASRLVALYINGRWPRSPHIRVAGALFGAFSWAQVAYLIADSTYLTTGVANPGMAVYPPLAVVELIAVARAMFDARYYRV